MSFFSAQDFLGDHYLDLNYCAERTEWRREEGYPKRVGVKDLIALISVLAAHPFS